MPDTPHYSDVLRELAEARRVAGETLTELARADLPGRRHDGDHGVARHATVPRSTSWCATSRPSTLIEHVSESVSSAAVATVMSPEPAGTVSVFVHGSSLWIRVSPLGVVRTSDAAGSTFGGVGSGIEVTPVSLQMLGRTTHPSGPGVGSGVIPSTSTTT